MSEPTASDVVAQLGEKASPRPWEADARFVYQAYAGPILHGHVEPNDDWETPEQCAANTALAALAVNSLPLVVKALESRVDTCYCDHKDGCPHDVSAKVLATVADAAKEALG